MDVYRCLGRPMPAEILAHPLAVESACAALLRTVVERRPVVRVSGTGLAESTLLAGLAVLASRLRRRGLRVTVAGEVFASLAPPGRPSGEVAILLEAPFYEDLGEWSVATERQTVFLVGQRSEWTRAAVEPDIEIAPPEGMDLSARRERWRESARAGRRPALSAALACDLASPGDELWDVHRASTLEPAGWYASDTGTWLAREESRTLAAAHPALTAEIRSFGSLGGRIARAARLWMESVAGLSKKSA